MKMEKTYNPSEFESRIYGEWLKNNCFKAKIDKKKEPFTIVMPPPNITGQLHMGHALDNTIQDAIIRFKRMQGYCALWLPGTDHASIATEVKIVEEMKKEGLSKKDLGREGFLERAWAWKEKYENRIIEQLMRLGASCDWSRKTFTMDEKCSEAVNEVFVKLYEKGLIYRGDRIINWCPSCKTALSDAEVEYETEAGHLWHIRYPFADGSGEIVVATTRPETMLGDTAVAVHPADARYADAVGKTLILPLVDKEIPVVADEYVEAEFGSGAVKITPAHDPNDFEVGRRHDLEVIRVMNDDGTMNDNAGVYAGLSAKAARAKIVEDLEARGHLMRVEDYTHNVGHCYRCGCTVEPIVSKQWFVKMPPLAEPAVAAVKKHRVEFIPERFGKIYLNWMENVKDWCVSRQLWWGHRIPAYYCENCGQTVVSKNRPDACPKCGAAVFKQDEDVLDTWFSSALWPFSTLGYPEKTADLAYFYPNNVLVTAYDIIFFWVARMIFSGIEHMGEIPFPEVLIHGIVRDAQGRKMSKSLGNGIDPLKIIDEYGADSLRFSLTSGIAPGSDIRYSDERTESARNFMNKLWNASRFVLMNAEGKKLKTMGSFRLNDADKWILTRLKQTVREGTKALEKYELGLANAKIYDFVWGAFCDRYIELAKDSLYGEDEERKLNTLTVLVCVLENILKLMQPFAPYITEEIYRNLPGKRGMLMLENWPSCDKKFYYKKESDAFEKVLEAIRALRNAKAERGVAPAKKIKVYLSGGAVAEKNYRFILRLAGVSEIAAEEADCGEKAVTLFGSYGKITVPLGELVDLDKERARLTEELARVRAEIERSQKLLANEGFTAKAPKALIDKERAKLEGSRALAERLAAELAGLD